MTIKELDQKCAENEFSRVRNASPLVHCLTNIVASAFTADLLAAAGASPAMIPAKEEAPDFARVASALLVNVGTLTSMDFAAMALSVKAAGYAKRPWVLDPVAAGITVWRDAMIAKLLLESPTVIRANPSEIIAISGGEKTSKGVDSVLGSHAALDAATRLAKNIGAIVAVTGEVDFITDGTETISVTGGDSGASRIVGTGCALSALCAAYVANAPEPLVAVASACALCKRAAEKAKGQPYASYRIAYLDAIETISSGIQ